MTPLHLAYTLGALSAQDAFTKQAFAGRSLLSHMGGGAALGGIGGAISGDDYSGKRILGGAVLGGAMGAGVRGARHLARGGKTHVIKDVAAAGPKPAATPAAMPEVVAPEAKGVSDGFIARMRAKVNKPAAPAPAAPAPAAQTEMQRLAKSDAETMLRNYREAGISPTLTPESTEAFRAAGLDINAILAKA